MPDITFVLLNLLSLVLWVLAGFAVLLEYRMTTHPKWMDADFVVVPVVLLLNAWAILSSAFLFQHIMQAGVGTLAAIVATPAIIILLVFVLWKALAMRTRLREAESGLSPFHIGHDHTLPQH